MKLSRWKELGVDIEALLSMHGLRSKLGGWTHILETCKYWKGKVTADQIVPITIETDLCPACWEENPETSELVREGRELEKVLEEYYTAEEEGFTGRGFPELYHVVQVCGSGRYAAHRWAGPLKQQALQAYHGNHERPLAEVRAERLAVFLQGREASGEEALLYVAEPGASMALGGLHDTEALIASSWWCAETPAPGFLLRAPREVAEYLELRIRYMNNEYSTTEARPTLAPLTPEDTAETIELAAALLDQESETFSTIEKALQAARALQHKTQEMAR